MSFTKDPASTLDYSWDWSDWLAEDETISTADVTVPTGLTKPNAESVATTGLVTVWLSGGTVGKVYDVVCRIVTNQGRTDERTIRVRVDNR